MKLVFNSKAQMAVQHPLEKFESWPKDTYFFCPKCALDNLELLFDSGLERFVRCTACGSLWIISASPCNMPAQAALI